MATELRKRQLESLNDVIRQIVPGNRFYHRKLSEAGGLEGFSSWRVFRDRMPFTTKEELVEDQALHPPCGSVLTYPLRRYTRYHQTSGTSGKPLVWLDTRESWQWVVNRWKPTWRAAGAREGDAALFTFSFGPFLGFWSAFEAATQLGICAIPAGGMGSVERLRFIMAQKPRFLCCTPTYALRLLEIAQAEGLDLAESGVEWIIVGGEPGGSVAEIRQSIEEGWRPARLLDHHGMTETGPVTFGDVERPNVLRVVHESFYCEVMKPGANEPVQAGEEGELILTTLGREACPLLRYRTGDIVKKMNLPGEDPAAFALDGGIISRADDMVCVRGVNLYPSAVEAVVRSVSGIGEYRVEVDQRKTMAEVSIKFESSNGMDDPSEELREKLRHAFQLRFNLSRLAPGTLPVFEMKARRWRILGERIGNREGLTTKTTKGSKDFRLA